MELLKDYDCSILYHPDKANVVADVILVIVDRLTKTTHFLSIKKTYSTDMLARLYVNRIVCLHGVPVSIVSDRGATFTSIL